MGYHVELFADAAGVLVVERRPDRTVSGIGTVFQAVGILFVMVVPVGLLSGGPRVALAMIACGVVPFAVGSLIRNTRQEVRVNGTARTVHAAWYLGNNAFPGTATSLRVARDGYVQSRRVRAYAGGDTRGGASMHAVAVAPTATAAPLIMLHTNDATDADVVCARIGAVLQIPARSEHAD